MAKGAWLGFLLALCSALAACASTRAPPAMQACWDGSIRPVDRACPAAPHSEPPPQLRACPDGSVVPVSASCPASPETHACPAGSVMLDSEICATPAQCPGPRCRPPDLSRPPVTVSYQEILSQPGSRSGRQPAADITSCPYGTEEDCARVETYIGGQRWIRSYIAYERSVNLDGEFTLQVTVDPNARQSEAELTAGMSDGAVARGRVRDVRLLAPVIEHPSTFEVTAQFPGEGEQVLGGAPIRWAWRVKAVGSSDAPQRIVVRLNTYVSVRGRRGPATEVGDPLVAEVRIVTPFLKSAQIWFRELDAMYKILAPLLGGLAAAFAWLGRYRKGKATKPRKARGTAAKTRA